MRYRTETALSFLPKPLIDLLCRRWRLLMDPADGWTFWIGVSYAKYCRVDRRRTGA